MSTKPSKSTSTVSSEPFPFPTSEKHDALPEHSKPVPAEPTEQALDNGVEESFPASDPVSVTVDKVVTPKSDKKG
ncbi:hypothetical protein [Variovorax sp. KK3]|uniref:hypothetical protein n=1 Tax=Variovorax sp. KK3 TaxID=1855728 RepID=UPI00097BC07C|nr:hypothetical protein [Variovorax sp. KK3]